MTATHQLETTLRSLGLSGMLETLDARLAQAGAGELGPKCLSKHREHPSACATKCLSPGRMVVAKTP